MRKPAILTIALAALAAKPALGQYLQEPGGEEPQAAIAADAGQGFLLAGAGFVPAWVTAPAVQQAASQAAGSGGSSGGSGGFGPFRRPTFNGAEQADDRPPKGSKPAGGGSGNDDDGRDRELQGKVMARAVKVAGEINSTGGYRFDGYNDCYGFVRRVWDPILSARGKPKLPVSDYPSREWAPVTDWKKIVAGDVLATHQGHRWGASWHGGFSWGMKDGTPMIYDNSPSNRGGAHIRPNRSFRYYHVPTHRRLTGKD